LFKDRLKFHFGFGAECHSKCTFGFGHKVPVEIRLRPNMLELWPNV